MMKVLVVDDNELLTGLIKEILEEMDESYQVKTAEDGEEGYMVFLGFDPDIILTDIEMPIKNGIEMIRDIRRHKPGIRTIYMSADLDRYQNFLETEKIRYKANLMDKPFTCSRIMTLFSEYKKEKGFFGT